jgi:UDP-glucuronate decarboxylase
VIALAQQQLGWQPKVPLQQGLEPTIADFRDRLADC